MKKSYQAIVIGASMGGMEALKMILAQLPDNFSLPVIVVQHQMRDSDDFLAVYLNRHCAIKVKEACAHELILPAYVYIAPAAYHLLIEEDKTLSLSVDLPVNYSIPSIDVLFESAADVYGESLVGVVLTGASADGSQGLKKIKAYGGLTVVQDPNTAEAPKMPSAAIKVTQIDHILPPDKIGVFLRELTNDEG
ncbi:chemotaxis protein CheB [Psychromonas sp. MB-3u-54]|uniref:chemotaxis protein CheB n=1 Tax=Psychromonas sp. MB-3u-54 TaxID=2058319 RepID=UPI000C3284B1|nr:chemotaxis protein CheB [Psychromonas sp. MB-3u-54]PKH02648.1 chemotaxis protein CheB [Psychromonas sp. MB-3u-54]